MPKFPPYVPRGEWTSNNPRSDPMEEDNQSPLHEDLNQDHESPPSRSFREIMIGTRPIFVKLGEFEKVLYVTIFEDLDPPYYDRPQISQQVKIGSNYVFVEVGPRTEHGNFPVYNPDHQIIIYYEPEHVEPGFSTPHEIPSDYHHSSPQHQINNDDSPQPHNDNDQFHQDSQYDEYFQDLINDHHNEIPYSVSIHEILQDPPPQQAPFQDVFYDMIHIEMIIQIDEDSINRRQFKTGDIVSICNRVYRYISKPYDGLTIGPFRIIGMEQPNVYHLESMNGFGFVASIHHLFIHHYHDVVP